MAFNKDRTRTRMFVMGQILHAAVAAVSMAIFTVNFKYDSDPVTLLSSACITICALTLSFKTAVRL